MFWGYTLPGFTATRQQWQNEVELGRCAGKKDQKVEGWVQSRKEKSFQALEVVRRQKSLDVQVEKTIKFAVFPSVLAMLRDAVYPTQLTIQAPLRSFFLFGGGFKGDGSPLGTSVGRLPQSLAQVAATHV